MEVYEDEQSSKEDFFPEATLGRGMWVASILALVMFALEVLFIFHMRQLHGVDVKYARVGGSSFVFGVFVAGSTFFAGVAFAGLVPRRGIAGWVAAEIIEISRDVFFALVVLILWVGVGEFALSLPWVSRNLVGVEAGYSFGMILPIMSIFGAYFVLKLSSRLVVGLEVARGRIQLEELRCERLALAAAWLGFSVGPSSRSVAGHVVPSGVRGAEGREVRSWLVVLGRWAWWGQMVLALMGALLALSAKAFYPALMFFLSGLLGYFQRLDLSDVVAHRARRFIGLLGFGSGPQATGIFVLLSIALGMGGGVLFYDRADVGKGQYQYQPWGWGGPGWVYWVFAFLAIVVGVLQLLYVSLIKGIWCRESELDRVAKVCENWPVEGKVNVSITRGQLRHLVALARLCDGAFLKPERLEKQLQSVWKSLDSSIQAWEREARFAIELEGKKAKEREEEPPAATQSPDASAEVTRKKGAWPGLLVSGAVLALAALVRAWRFCLRRR